jgi:hypothetical protein
MCLNGLDAGKCHNERPTRILTGDVWLARLLNRGDELNELCGVGITHQFDITARRLFVQSGRIAASTAASERAESSSVSDAGFSQKIGLPAAAQATIRSACASADAAITTASTLLS